MQISMWVLYDEQRLRCTLQFQFASTVEGHPHPGRRVDRLRSSRRWQWSRQWLVACVAVLLGGLFGGGWRSLPSRWLGRCVCSRMSSRTGVTTRTGRAPRSFWVRAGAGACQRVSHNGHVLQDVRTAISTAQILLSCEDRRADRGHGVGRAALGANFQASARPCNSPRGEIAAAQFISVRTLHRLFETQQRTARPHGLAHTGQGAVHRRTRWHSGPWG